MNSLPDRVRLLSGDKRALLTQQLPPVSFSQQRMWLLQGFQPGKHYYNLPSAVELKGPLNRVALDRAFAEIVRRHEVLRSNFLMLDGSLIQLISRPEPFLIPLVDLRKLPIERRHVQARKLAKSESQCPFDLERDRLIRIRLLQLEEAVFVLLLTMHHIVSDAWSRSVLMRELAVLYQAYLEERVSPLPDLPVQYADYARRQRKWFESGDVEQEIKYWQEKLRSSPPLLDLPTDRHRPAVQTFRGSHESLALGTALSVDIQQLSLETNSTAFILLLAAFQVLLTRYSGHKDIAVGTLTAGRHWTEVEASIGCFVNTLVMRTDLGGDPTFLEVLERVRETAIGAFSHQSLPFEKLLEVLGPERYLSHAPIFQVMFTLQNTFTAAIPLRGVSLSLWDYEMGISQFDIRLSVAEGLDGFSLTIEYNTDLFDRLTAKRILQQFGSLLEGIVRCPKSRVSKLSLLSAKERGRLLKRGRGEEVTFAGGATLVDLFAEQVRRSPEAVAVVFGNQRWSYGELNRRANQVAHYLRRKGVGPEVVVGIAIKESVELLVGLLGIVKAGGSYLPLQVRLANDSLKYAIKEAGVRLLLVNDDPRMNGCEDQIEGKEIEVVSLEREHKQIEQEAEEDIRSRVSAENMVTLFYSAEAAEEIKGIMICHEAIRNRVLWMQRRYLLESKDRVLQLVPFDAEAAVVGFFWPLVTGAELVLRSSGRRLKEEHLSQVIEEGKITTLVLGPSTLRIFLEEDRIAEQCKTLKRVICTGGAWDPELVARLSGVLKCELYCHYGATDAAADGPAWGGAARQRRRALAIGQAIDNVQTYVLDEEMEPTPLRVEGEIYLGGMTVARGYIGMPGLTAERFVPDPVGGKPGARLYRTSDIGSWSEDGSVEYLRRRDRLVNVRGYRIGLAEVEAGLLRCPGVLESAVVPSLDACGVSELIAYVVVKDGIRAGRLEWEKELGKHLPRYMVPAVFVELEELPRTVSNEIDWGALPPPSEEDIRPKPGYIAPRTATEESLARLWAELLKVDRVGVEDSFFRLGGHSLLAVHFVSRARDVFGIELPLRQMFETPWIAQLASVIDHTLFAETIAGQQTASPFSVGNACHGKN